MSKKKSPRNKRYKIEIDNSLEKYLSQPLFQEKVDEANKVLRTVKLPGKRKVCL